MTIPDGNNHAATTKLELVMHRDFNGPETLGRGKYCCYCARLAVA